MANNFCLPPEDAAKFTAALRDGTIDRRKLSNMTSEERRAFFVDIVGKDMAEPVNALLESKLLRKDQMRGFATWARQATGISEPTRRDMLSRISNMDRLLNPAEARMFMADLAKQKLGVAVTAEQGQRISALAKTAQIARDEQRAKGASPQTIRTLGLAYQDFGDYVESLRPDVRPLWEKVLDVTSIPRTLLTLGHTSAPGVQGWGMITTKYGAEGAYKQFRWLWKEQNYRNMMADIIGHPDYELARKAGLSITDLSRMLDRREEAIQSTLVEALNRYLSDKSRAGMKAIFGLNVGLPNVARAGSRAFTGYLNYVRFNRWLDLKRAAEMRGEDISPGSQVLKDLATVVNNFTGRGDLGPLNNSAAILNTFFFAPRKIAGTVQMFNPVKILDPRISLTARIAAVRQLGGSIIATAALWKLADSMGMPVDFNPLSSNFGKIQMGDTKMDVTGGNAIYLRLLARLFTGRMITASGREMELGIGGAPSRLGLIGQFLRNKFSPTFGAIIDRLGNQDTVGRPFNIGRELQDKTFPIATQSFIHFANRHPAEWIHWMMTPFMILGAGTEGPVEHTPEDYGDFAPTVRSFMESPSWQKMSVQDRDRTLNRIQKKWQEWQARQQKAGR
jgi:hypothetical protein